MRKPHLSFHHIKVILFCSLFLIQTDNLPLRHSLIAFATMLLLFPLKSIEFTFLYSTGKKVRNNELMKPIYIIWILVWFILLSWPIYLLLFITSDAYINPFILSKSFNNMVGYCAEIIVSMFIIYILLRNKDNINILKIVFWSMTITFTIYQFCTGDLINRFSLMFKEPSSAAVYVFAFTFLAFIDWLNDRQKINLFLSFIGIAILIFLVRSKASYIYIFLFFIIVTFHHIIHIKISKFKYILTIISIVCVAFYLSVNYGNNKNALSKFIHEIYKSDNYSHFMHSDILTLSTRATLLHSGIQLALKKPLGVGYGFHNFYIYDSLKHDIVNRELSIYLKYNKNLSTKSYLSNYLLSTGLIGCVLLIKYILCLLNIIKNHYSYSYLYLLSLLISLMFAALLVEGFYFFFLSMLLITCYQHNRVHYNAM